MTELPLENRFSHLSEDTHYPEDNTPPSPPTLAAMPLTLPTLHESASLEAPARRPSSNTLSSQPILTQPLFKEPKVKYIWRTTKKTTSDEVTAHIAALGFSTDAFRVERRESMRGCKKVWFFAVLAAVKTIQEILAKWSSSKCQWSIKDPVSTQPQHPSFLAQSSLRNHITSSLKHSKASFFRSLSHAAPSKFWSFVKSLHTSSIPTLSSDGTPIESDLSKAQCLNEFFSSCFNSSAPPLSPIPPFSPLLPCPDELLRTNDSIRCLISKLPLKTATGPDGISSWMLKATSSHIAPPLCHIFNLSISTGLVALDWKSSFIVPVPKLSPPSNSSSNYRPISLLCLISKLLETFSLK